MKINVKFLTTHLAICLFMAVPFVKAQQPSATCVSQCEAFCAAVTSNFASGATGPLSDGTLKNLINALPQGSAMQSIVSTFQTQYMDPTVAQMNQFLLQQILLGDCSPETANGCSQMCTPYPSPAKSIAQKSNVAPTNKAAASK